MATRIIIAGGVMVIVALLVFLYWFLGQLVIGYAQMEAAERMEDQLPRAE